MVPTDDGVCEGVVTPTGDGECCGNTEGVGVGVADRTGGGVGDPPGERVLGLINPVRKVGSTVGGRSVPLVPSQLARVHPSQDPGVMVRLSKPYCE